MKETIEQFSRDFFSCIQMRKMYPAEHPQCMRSVDVAFAQLQKLLSRKSELVIGIVGEELTVESEIFFELSKKVQNQLQYFKERGIEKIIFYKGIEKEEIGAFISSLLDIPEGADIGEKLLAEGIKHVAAGKIKSGSAEKKSAVQEAVGYFDHYVQCLEGTTSSLEAVLNDEALDYAKLQWTMTNVVEHLIENYQEILKITAMKRYDVTTFMHLLNVAVLAMYFSSKLGFSKKEISDVGIAALFHDIGKIHITRKIIVKKGKLSDAEFDQIKSHTLLGAQILLKYVDTLGVVPVVVAFEHHLRYDLRGYPRTPFLQRPHMVSFIVSLCDVYDALTQRRTYKRSYAPEAIYDLMLREKDGAFPAALLDNFFQMMGVWPPGTIVQLSDRRVAIVRQENEGAIFAPHVEVVSGKIREIIDLSQTEGALKIERSLNPLHEGKDYLPLI